MRKLLSVVVIALAFAACSSVDCPVETRVTTQYAVYTADGQELKLTDTLTVTTQRSNATDTVLLNKAIGLSSFSLPVSYSHPEDVLCFYFDNDEEALHAVDTVWVKKTDMPHFESVDCSAIFFHQLEGVRYTRHAIDSLVIKQTNVDYDNTTVHFYLYPKVGD